MEACRREELLGRWALHSIRDDGRIELAVAHARAELRFDPGDRLLCLDSVNTTTARYFVGDGGAIHIELGAKTLIGGPTLRQDGLLEAVLRGARRFHTSRDSLTLFDWTGSTLAVFVPLDAKGTPEDPRSAQARKERLPTKFHRQTFFS